MTGAAIRELRHFLQLTQADFARLLEVSLRSVVRYEDDSTTPLPATMRRLERLRETAPELAKRTRAGAFQRYPGRRRSRTLGYAERAAAALDKNAGFD